MNNYTELSHAVEGGFVEVDGERFNVNRHIYKNLLGNKSCFEEINNNLKLAFCYTWVSSDTYGFARQCQLHNLGGQKVTVNLLDGLQNILPAGTPRHTQTISSNLVDAYKWSELDEQTGLGLFALYSGITDRAEPCESLKANTVFCLGLENHTVLLSSREIDNFRGGMPLQQEVIKRGGTFDGQYQVVAQDWCQVPVVYHLDGDADPGLVIDWADGEPQTMTRMALTAQASSELFLHGGHIRQLTLTIARHQLFAG